MQHLIRTAIGALALCACFGAVAAEPAASAPTTPPAAAAPAAVARDVPGGSLVGHADALRADVLRQLQAYAKGTHGCDAPQVVDTNTRRAAGKIKLDGDGRLRVGKVTEQWKVDVCGTTRTLTLVLAPAEGDAHSIEISERS